MRTMLTMGLLFATACVDQPAAAPATAYKAFVSASDHGDSQAAWALLSKPTQDELTRQATAVATARGQPAPADGRVLAFGERYFLRSRVKDVDVVQSAGDHATVEVLDDAQQKQRVQMVREGTGWRLDLVDVVKRPAL